MAHCAQIDSNNRVLQVIPAGSGTGNPPKVYLWDENTTNWLAVKPLINV